MQDPGFPGVDAGQILVLNLKAEANPRCGGGTACAGTARLDRRAAFPGAVLPFHKHATLEKTHESLDMEPKGCLL